MATTKFKAGESGNPRGRPKAKTPATLLRKSIADDMPEIIKTLISLAKGGDVAAAKILIDRICPALKSQAIDLCLPVMDSLTEQGNEIIKATMTGKVPPDIGGQLITALVNQSKIVAIDDVLKRLEALENRNEH